MKSRDRAQVADLRDVGSPNDYFISLPLAVCNRRATAQECGEETRAAEGTATSSSPRIGSKLNQGKRLRSKVNGRDILILTHRWKSELLVRYGTERCTKHMPPHRFHQTGGWSQFAFRYSHGMTSAPTQFPIHWAHPQVIAAIRSRDER